MPDLTVHTTWTCSTNIMWGPIRMKSASTGETYYVSWGRLFGKDFERRGAQFGWICTCKGFKFRSECKHTKAVEKSGRRCGWNSVLELEEPAYNKKGETVCPECGREAHPMQVAV